MSRGQRVLKCRVWRLPAAAIPTAYAPPRAAGLSGAQAQSTHRCRQRLSLPGVSGLVVNAVMFDRRPPRFAVPDGNRTSSFRFLLAEVNLGLRGLKKAARFAATGA